VLFRVRVPSTPEEGTGRSRLLPHPYCLEITIAARVVVAGALTFLDSQ
jgi:hypothetical protein